MASSLSLGSMVDLALGTPEVGSVNFNVLHTLLHAILTKLDISAVSAELSDADKESLTQRKVVEDDSKSVADSGITGLTVGGESERAKSATSEKSIPASHSPYHQLEGKVSRLEQQIDALNQLPSNAELFERARGDAQRPRPVADMWQSMQLSRKVEANEEGVSKLMSLFEDMMKEMDELKKANEELKKEMDNNLKANSLEDILKRISDLEALTADLKNQVDNFPPADFFNDFVTWAALEDHLRGIRQQVEDGLNRPIPEPVIKEVTAPAPPPPEPVVVQRVVIEMSSQTEAPSRPSTRPSSARTSTPGPSAELMELLESLGKLTDKHDILEGRVDVIEEELKNKADKSALEGLGTGVPDDLLQRLAAMQELLDSFKKGRDKDSEALTRMQKAILNLQAELERLSNTAQQLIDDNTAKQKDIESLYQICVKLDENKADKEFVQSEVDVKADKRLVDGKVNRALFDSTCEELNKMIADILGKLGGHEDEWKKLLAQLSSDIDGKLDRLEFGPIKDELERQLKALLKKLNSMHAHPGDVMDDDAAGIRKQLIQRFHCISCDRPVEMMPQGPIPSIPAPSGLPATRSARPYTTYELEQIRQHAKSLNQTQQIDVMDLYSTTRSCGGSHTLTHPNRRITKPGQTGQINTLFREEEPPPPSKEELDIQGADGHIYRGRYDKTRFPNLQATHQGFGSKSPKMGRSKTQGPRPPPQEPMTARPASARMSRPTSANQTPRPVSAAGGHHHQQRHVTMTEVTSSMSPPPPRAPAPSEPDPQQPRTPSPSLATGGQGGGLIEGEELQVNGGPVAGNENDAN